MDYFRSTLTYFTTCSITAATLHEKKPNCAVYTKYILLVEDDFNRISSFTHFCFTWHVLYTVFQHGYVSLTAYICVHPALSEKRTGHSVTWQAELKQCQHIRPRRDEFQQLTEHFVTVT